ncbi:hypothetical protein [Leptolyngbya sp. FACHB-261]|uniref:hypothetical protein n=1 Tax=Leptolyngbya sp. FACHB-261 TaxID=2692806 RepID=UPI0016861086|nr:hypothetical protein [Leptolyngbya sp. FACHB-261]MBD2103456.1 hypothetical protein [Leptolyngbya sp. FACHB-261]
MRRPLTLLICGALLTFLEVGCASQPTPPTTGTTPDTTPSAEAATPEASPSPEASAPASTNTTETTAYQPLSAAKGDSVFTTCPDDTRLSSAGETANYRFVICYSNGQPRYYIGADKKGGEPVTVRSAGDASPVFRNGDYTYALYSDGKNAKNSYLQVFKGKRQLLEEQVLSLYTNSPVRASSRDIADIASSNSSNSNGNSSSARADANLAPVLQSVLGQVKQAKVPVRLPSNLTSETKQGLLYASALVTPEGGYSISLSTVPDCGGAGACTTGYFVGESALTLDNFGESQDVQLANGISGRFFPMRCGASCSGPDLQWIQDGVRYTITMREDSNRDDLIALANSSIVSGPR